jgi:hypothetical protein
MTRTGTFFAASQKARAATPSSLKSTKRLHRILERILSLRTTEHLITQEIFVPKPDRVALDSASYPDTKTLTG